MCNRDLAEELFDLGCRLNRTYAAALAPDVDTYNDELARRGDMLDAAKEADVSDRASSILSATDMQTIAALSEWFIDEILKDGHAELIERAKSAGGFFTEALNRAATAKAENDWEEAYRNGTLL